MSVTHWEPLMGMNRLEREMDQLFRAVSRRSPSFSRSKYPPLNLSEDDENFYVEAELPGLAIDDLEVQVSEGNQLSISGERKRPEPEQASWHRQERAYGEFQRTVALPADVNPDNVSATFSDGVLTISLAKAEEAKPRKVVIKAD